MSDELESLPGFGAEGVAPGENHAQAGTPAEHEWGVQYQGPFESATDGSARAVRLHARALASTGVPVLLQSFTYSFIGPDGVRVGSQAMAESVKRETHDLRHQSIRDLRIRIKHMVVSTAERLRASIVPSYVAIEQDQERAMAVRQHLYNTTIVYSVWERSTISESIAAILRRVGECWVPCYENRSLLQRYGVTRVHVVPHPWEESSDIAKLVRRPARPNAKKAFYSIGVWQPRKHYHETIGGFLMAFRPEDTATLTIKHRYASVPGYPSPEASVEHWLKQSYIIDRGWTKRSLAEHLWLPSGEWSEDRITKLHFDSNIYVCASRGEAFCLPAFDAKIAGNRMILVGYGGQRDFSGDGDLLIPYAMGDVPKEYGWEDGAQWAVARVEDIAEVMRRVEAPTEYTRPSTLAQYTLPCVGAFMRDRSMAVLARAEELSRIL